MTDIKTKIEDLLRSTGREGIASVIEHLRKGGFYTAPASVTFHNNRAGGLAMHSYQVCMIATDLFNEQKSNGVELQFGLDSIIVCSLLHDVCKMDEYTVDRHGQPHHTRAYHAGTPKPHGTKSVDLLTQWGLRLTDEETKAIHWHMGHHATDACMLYGHSYPAASDASLLVHLIHEADMRNAMAAKR